MVRSLLEKSLTKIGIITKEIRQFKEPTNRDQFIPQKIGVWKNKFVRMPFPCACQRAYTHTFTHTYTFTRNHARARAHTHTLTHDNVERPCGLILTCIYSCMYT